MVWTDKKAGIGVLLAFLVVAGVVSTFRAATTARPSVLLQDVDPDEKLLFSGAPQAVKQVVGGLKAIPQLTTGSRKQITDAAQREYSKMLEHYERQEASLRKAAKSFPTTAQTEVAEANVLDPDTDPDAPSSAEKQLEHADSTIVSNGLHGVGTDSTERLVREIEQQNGLDGLFDPAAVQHEMEQDVKHPPKYEVTEEKRLMDVDAPDARLKQLERKVNELEGLNARLALGQQAATQQQVSPSSAAERSLRIAREGLKAVSAHANSVVLIPAAATDPAAQHALNVAIKAGDAAVKRAEADTKGMLDNKGSFKMPKLPGVSMDAWAGVKHAINAGKPDARKIPGVKESTWPFAPGSFQARDVRIPGVNQDSWWVFEPGQSWGKDRQAVSKRVALPGQGGCVPDASGKLRCDGGHDGVVLADALDKAVGLADKRAKLVQQPGEIQSIIPEIRTDAESQKLNAAAAAFGEAMSARRGAREQLLWQQSQHARDARLAKFQDLEVVGEQCSTFLDCLRIRTKLVDHHTHPMLFPEWDVQASSPEDTDWMRKLSENLPTVPNPFPDDKVRMGTDYIGYISRPSARNPARMVHDIPADELPSSQRQTMYSDETNTQALAQWELFQSMLAEANETSANATNGTNATADEAEKPDPRVWVATVCEKGVNCDSSPAFKLPNFKGSSGGVCDHGVNCDSGFKPFAARVQTFGDDKWNLGAGEAQPLGGEYPIWTPFMYTPNKPTTWTPGQEWQPDYGMMARRARFAQGQMMASLSGEEDGEPITAGGSDRLSNKGVNVDSGWMPYTYEQIWGRDESSRGVPRKPKVDVQKEEEDAARREQERREEEERLERERIERERLERERLEREEAEARERERKARLLDSAPAAARERIMEEERRRAEQQEAIEAQRRQQQAEAGTSETQQAEAGTVGQVAADEIQQAVEDHANEPALVTVACDKVMCGDAEGDVLGMRTRGLEIPKEQWGLMDRLEKTDGERGLANLQHAYLSVTGQIPPGHVDPHSLHPGPSAGEVRAEEARRKAEEDARMKQEQEEAERVERERQEAEEKQRAMEEAEARESERKAHVLDSAPAAARERIMEEERRRAEEQEAIQAQEQQEQAAMGEGVGQGMPQEGARGVRSMGLWQQGLGELNKVTADMDRVTRADDVSDMDSLHGELRGMVERMRQRRDAQ